jgi:hypothetical protein
VLKKPRKFNLKKLIQILRFELEFTKASLDLMGEQMIKKATTPKQPTPISKEEVCLIWACCFMFVLILIAWWYHTKAH